MLSAVNNSVRRRLTLLGPAFVAAVAYVDPGNVAANITAGARYGFLLLWVLVVANTMSVIVQYQAAKLGLVTGKSLPQLLHDHMSRPARWAYFAQAEIVIIATDLAEIVGGAVALNLLFGLPLLLGGTIMGVASLGLLAFQTTHNPKIFETIIVGLLLVITVGFIAGLVVTPPPLPAVAEGLIPRFAGPDSVLVAASMLGATVMPHAIYLHSSLVRNPPDRLAPMLAATRIDVVSALALAGTVNIALLVLAGTALPETDTLADAHAAIDTVLGGGISTVFAIGLLASSLASTSVGAYAGAEIMDGLLDIDIPLWLMRVITLIPALAVLALGAEPTWALVVSQVILSFGIPFALIPLTWATGSAAVMGRYRNTALLRVLSVVITAVIVVLNAVLVWQVLAG